METIRQLVFTHASSQPQATALLAPGLAGLSYAGLESSLQLISSELAGRGLRRTDRVAIVMPGGPESALSFLSVCSVAVSAPLNPHYQQSEFEFYLADLQAGALLTLAGYQTHARSAAAALGIPLIELVPGGHWFSLAGSAAPSHTPPPPAAGQDIALVLHTSGTTARPKQVLLTHANLVASAENIRSWLSLTPADRCLNIMPLFHIHGLVAALLASLAAGGSVVCTPAFNAPKFFDWMDEFSPTWYTAVPTMHQSILARAQANLPVIHSHPLRFIRSSSAPLPPQLMQQLEQVFAAPVVEAYGMTEASHQMASNPLPPQPRKAGSVGLPAGPQVSIMQEDGPAMLPQGSLGEIVIRGPNVTAGYHANPEANQKAFSDGWFRTGDQGYVDPQGYLFITGRLKELINRGGEKISPREVEETLLDHPAVAQAVVFALPDVQLGEDVAAAVVLREPGLTEAALRQFAALRLALFKVPKRVVILEEIPKGATGKVQRIGLAQRLGLAGEQQAASAVAAHELVQPRNSTESSLHDLWCQVLRLPQVGVTQPFLEVGGDSMLATLLLARVQEQFQLDLTLLEFFEAQTIAEQATLVQEKQLLAGKQA